MASIIKVDTIQTAAGGTPSLSDLGIATTGTGKVLQVVQGTATSQGTGATETYVDTGLSASITPSSTSSKILVTISQPMYHQRNTNQPVILFFRILRGSTTVYENDRASGLNAGTASNGYIELYNPINTTYLDSPSTTSATTYKTQYRVLTSSNSSAATAQPNNQYGVITLMEIAG